MANSGLANDDLVFEFDSNGQAYFQGQPWGHMMNDVNNAAARPDMRRAMAPIQTHNVGLRQTTMPENPMLEHWRYQQTPAQLNYPQQHQAHQHQHQHSQQLQQQPQHQQQPLDIPFNDYSHGLPMTSQSMEMIAASQPPLTSSAPINTSYLQMASGIEGMPQNWADFHTELVSYSTMDAGVAVSPYQQHSSSPTGSHIEVMSQPSSCDEPGWTLVDSTRQSFESYDRPYFIDPSQTLHRALSESSYSDLEQPSHFSLGNNLDMMSSQAVCSPTSLSDGDFDFNHVHPHQYSVDHNTHHSAGVSPSTLVNAIAIPTKKGSPPARSPGSQGSASSPGRKASRKSPIAKATDKVIKKQSSGPKGDTEKRVGRRKGPLRPEQRKQASEIRKLRACLRCKFLKKTCDKGEPCAGCQPSHARLWQVPCTRIDIKEIGYFLKDCKFDYERHVTLGFSVGNIKGFSDAERTLFITHGYGHMLPITAREVYVRDESCLKIDWAEGPNKPAEYEVSTAKLSAGMEGISTTMLSDYLDRHIDGTGTFEHWVDDYFEGTPFLSQMLKTAYRFYFRTDSKIIRKALKLTLAYNLTLSCTMVEGVPNEMGLHGKVEDDTSKYFGKTMAPVMINFQIKCAMADMWRELHKDVLEELSALYSSVYSGDKLKNWPTIFILASVLLGVWECMQFDCNYRVPDNAVVEKFCNDMETTPVGVIIGLFQAISQKLPTFLEWDTSKHHQLLGSNQDVCNTMTEVRENVKRYGNFFPCLFPFYAILIGAENYLRGRPNAKYDRGDFDSLSNKFLSKLVIRAN
jgi:hypothetical protein